MNRELKRVTIVALLMFLTLFVASTVIQYVQASNLAADPRNARTLYQSYSVERGPILVGGDPIAFSEPSDDDYKFQRVYSNGPLYAPVTGFIPVNGEATGLVGRGREADHGALPARRELDDPDLPVRARDLVEPAVVGCREAGEQQRIAATRRHDRLERASIPAQQRDARDRRPGDAIGAPSVAPV